MFKQMSNREFSDWLADEGARWASGRRDHVIPDVLAECLREASQRIKSSTEWQTDVRMAHRPHPEEPR